jgi:uncharacterized alkaline shock family protein YloU
VSRRAVAAVVAEAVAGCQGVTGIAPRNSRRGLGMLLRRQNVERGIAVRPRDGRVTIDLYVIVEYGARIREVGRNVADAVCCAVERSFRVPVERVTVNVQGLHLSDDTDAI